MLDKQKYKLSGGIFLLLLAAGAVYLYRQIYVVSICTGGVETLHCNVSTGAVEFTVEKGESVAALAHRLEQEKIIGNAFLFRKYLAWKDIDRKIQAGSYTINPPVTLARVAEALEQQAERQEKTITILPGWDLREVAEYLVSQGFARDAEEVYEITGEPVKHYPIGTYFGPSLELIESMPHYVEVKKAVSLEGYLAPETIRVFADAPLAEGVIDKFIFERDKEITGEMRQKIKKQGKTIHEILTVASIIEREVQRKEDKAKVADIFWRRLTAGVALQADSTVHYAVGKKGNVYTTEKDRASKNEWNTYKYPGLPPGPICNPGIDSIMAAIYPEKNSYWYFLTTPEGEVKYAKTNEEHNVNRVRYLR